MMMLGIDREWGRDPGWSLGLPGAEQEILIGYQRARMPRRGAGRGPGGAGGPGGRRG